jgi:hypothetical protein
MPSQQQRMQGRLRWLRCSPPSSPPDIWWATQKTTLEKGAEGQEVPNSQPDISRVTPSRTLQEVPDSEPDLSWVTRDPESDHKSNFEVEETGTNNEAQPIKEHTGRFTAAQWVVIVSTKCAAYRVIR